MLKILEKLSKISEFWPIFRPSQRRSSQRGIFVLSIALFLRETLRVFLLAARKAAGSRMGLVLRGEGITSSYVCLCPLFFLTTAVFLSAVGICYGPF